MCSRKNRQDGHNDFTAAAGHDYGYVAAWQLPCGKWVIRYGDNIVSECALADDGDHLEDWLLRATMDDDAVIIHCANVLGADAIDEAPEDSERDLAVMVTRYYYGPTERSDMARDDRGEL